MPRLGASFSCVILMLFFQYNSCLVYAIVILSSICKLQGWDTATPLCL